MAGLTRGSASAQKPAAPRGLLIAASSVAAAAGISLTQRAIRRRLSRGADHEPPRYRVEPGQPTDQELRRVAAAQLERARENLGHDPEDAEAIHDARKALKRSRALLRVSRHLLGQDTFARENRNLRDAGRELSQARDQQALSETVASLAEQTNGAEPDAAIARLREVVEEPAEAQPQPDQDAALQAVAETRSRVPDWSLPANSEPSSLAPGLRRIYRQGRRALARVRKKATDERWHELRKRSKDLRHATELLRRAQPKRMRKVAEQARRLSNLLGEDHDLALLGARLRASPLGREDVRVLGRLIERRRDELQREARGVARRLYRRKPKQFIRWLGLA